MTRQKSRMYNERYFDAVHFFRYFLLDGNSQLILKVGKQQIAINGDFPNLEGRWARIADKRFEPIYELDTDDEDDVLNAVIESVEIDDSEWDWGAEHSEEDR